MQTPNEQLRESLLVLWDSKRLIAAVTAAFLVAGAVLYTFVPRNYEGRISIFPLSQDQFADYLGLTQIEGAFPYTPFSLYAEFSLSLREFDRLMALAAETGVVDRGAMNDEGYAQEIRRFVSTIRFENPRTQDIIEGQRYFSVVAKAEDPDKLIRFMQLVVARTNESMAKDLATEVRKRAAELKRRAQAQIDTLQVDIDARRLREQSERNDDIIRLSEQSEIARSLGIEKPLDLRVIEAVEKGSSAAAQINSSSPQPLYLQGYAALNERIEMARNRKNGDAFVPDLRQIQQQLYIVKNDTRPAFILSSVELSPLGNPTTATVARFQSSLVAVEKKFPKFGIFAFGSLLAGLMTGIAIVLIGGERMARSGVRTA